MPYKNNNPQNLIPLTELPEDEARKIRQKGALASAKAKKERKLLRELLADALQEEIQLKKNGKPTGKYIKAELAITRGLINSASNGNSRAYEVIRDTLGEKPAERTIVETTTTPPTIAEMFAFEDELERLSNGENTEDTEDK